MRVLTIKRIAVSNFKSFDYMVTELGRLNVVIGANASGKSNFVSIFKFLKDIFTNGLDNAFAMQGGVDCVRNMNIRTSKDLSVEISIILSVDTAFFPTYTRRNGKRVLVNIDPTEMTYSFCVEFYKKKRGYVVKEERLESKFNFTEVEKAKRELKKGKKIGEGKIALFLDKMGRFEFHIEPRDSVSMKEIFPFMRFKKKIPIVRALRSRKELNLLGTSFPRLVPNVQALTFFSPFSSTIRGLLSEIALYDIDPKLSKRSTLITGRTELDSDGSNLATVLKNILSTKKNRKRLSNIVRDLLPFIEDISVEKQADRSLLACLKEIYCGKRYLPAPLISDGTINVTALIIALYFERNPITIIEEPERNIHPILISKIIDMMRDVSEKMGKQIIITTHNPEVVKSAGIENLLLIYRERNTSRIDRPSEKEKVRNFLKNEIGVDELFVKNLLGV